MEKVKKTNMEYACTKGIAFIFSQKWRYCNPIVIKTYDFSIGTRILHIILYIELYIPK
jgi:hypothetical protein